MTSILDSKLSSLPQKREDADKLAAVLARFVRNEPNLKVSTNSYFGETLIAGMGQLHLQVYVERISRRIRFSCDRWNSECGLSRKTKLSG